MAVNLTGKSLISLKDYSYDEIRYLMDLAHTVKKERKSNIRKQRFTGMSIALLFEKRSTRTRCAFETAFGEEGGTSRIPLKFRYAARCQGINRRYCKSTRQNV